VDDVLAMRTEIAHLRGLAAMSTDNRVIEEIEIMIGELEGRIKRTEDGQNRDHIIGNGSG
jgi:hypothetical protein